MKQQADTVAGILAAAAKQEESVQREMERRNKELARKKLNRQLNMEARMEYVCENRKQVCRVARDHMSRVP